MTRRLIVTTKNQLRPTLAILAMVTTGIAIETCNATLWILGRDEQRELKTQDMLACPDHSHNCDGDKDHLLGSRFAPCFPLCSGAFVLRLLDSFSLAIGLLSCLFMPWSNLPCMQSQTLQLEAIFTTITLRSIQR
nr:hypothetical protein Iba_chr07eCG0170 [Ipomoea batatas]